MEIKFGNGKTKYGPGVQIDLTGNEVACAIYAYLVAHGVHVDGPRTVTVNGEQIKAGEIYVDPSGYVVNDGVKLPGEGFKNFCSIHNENCDSEFENGACLSENPCPSKVQFSDFGTRRKHSSEDKPAVKKLMEILSKYGRELDDDGRTALTLATAIEIQAFFQKLESETKK